MEDKNRNDIKRRLEELRKENNRKNDSKDDGNKSPFGSPLVFFTIILIAFTFIFYGSIQEYFQPKKNITYSEFVNKIKDGSFRKRWQITFES